MLLEESGPSSSPVSAADIWAELSSVQRAIDAFPDLIKKDLMQTHQEIAVMLHDFLDHPRLCLGLRRQGMLSDYADHQVGTDDGYSLYAVATEKARVKLDDPELYVDGRHAEQIRELIATLQEEMRFIVTE